MGSKSPACVLLRFLVMLSAAFKPSFRRLCSAPDLHPDRPLLFFSFRLSVLSLVAVCTSKYELVTGAAVIDFLLCSGTPVRGYLEVLVSRAS